MSNFVTCLGLGSFSAEDAAELRGFIRAAGSEVDGVKAYLSSLDADMADLRAELADKLGMKPIAQPDWLSPASRADFEEAQAATDYAASFADVADAAATCIARLG